jgi:hypothetical protein
VKDVDNLNVKGFFSSYHLRSNFEASHSLASFIFPSHPSTSHSSLGSMGNNKGVPFPPQGRTHEPSTEKQKGGLFLS